jgi:hypothetical protein
MLLRPGAGGEVAGAVAATVVAGAAADVGGTVATVVGGDVAAAVDTGDVAVVDGGTRGSVACVGELDDESLHPASPAATTAAPATAAPPAMNRRRVSDV